MPIAPYGVLKCRPSQCTPGTDSFTHVQIIAEDPGTQTSYQIDVNVRSKDQSEVLYHHSDPFQHEMLDRLVSSTSFGINPLDAAPGALGLDYLRGNLFDVADMRPLGMEAPASDDLNLHLTQAVSEAQAAPDAIIYAFGQYFEDPPSRARPGKPAKGIHDIHMNQGNFGRFEGDNGTYRDGGLLIHFPSQNRWVAFFLAFQVQSFQTDDRGYPIGGAWVALHGGKEQYETAGG